MTAWLVQPEWDEGDDWETAVGTGEVIEADSAEAAKAFYLGHGDGRNTRPHWISCLPVSEAPTYAVEAGRQLAARRKQAGQNKGEGASAS